MISNISFIKHRLRLSLGTSPESKASQLTVRWVEITGGVLDETTRARVDGDELHVSGTLPAFVHSEPAHSVVRQHAEIKTGDLICDIDSDPQVTLFDGQQLSGVMSLASLSNKSVRFIMDGEVYAQADIGEDLAATWDVRFKDQRLQQTLVLRRAV